MAVSSKKVTKEKKAPMAKPAKKVEAKSSAASKRTPPPSPKKSTDKSPASGLKPAGVKPASLMAAMPVLAAPAQIPASVQSMLDKGEIAEILYRVARGLDRIDETLLRSVFHHEATLDLGPGVFQGTSNDYIHWVIGVMNQVRSSHHMIGNILPTLEGDVALVESYCHAHFRMDKPTGREDIFIGSRFLDRFERRPSGSAGVWKIMHRKQIIDWVRTEAVSDLFYHQNPDALWSFRTKTDPSYQMAQFPGSQQGSKLPAFLGRRYESKSVKF